MKFTEVKHTPEKLTLTLPEGTINSLELKALEHNRSINAEIVVILGLALRSSSYASLLSEEDLSYEVSLRSKGRAELRDVNTSSANGVLNAEEPARSIRHDADLDGVESRGD